MSPRWTWPDHRARAEGHATTGPGPSGRHAGGSSARVMGRRSSPEVFDLDRADERHRRVRQRRASLPWCVPAAPRRARSRSPRCWSGCHVFGSHPRSSTGPRTRSTRHDRTPSRSRCDGFTGSREMGSPVPSGAVHGCRGDRPYRPPRRSRAHPFRGAGRVANGAFMRHSARSRPMACICNHDCAMRSRGFRGARMRAGEHGRGSAAS